MSGETHVCLVWLSPIFLGKRLSAAAAADRLSLGAFTLRQCTALLKSGLLSVGGNTLSEDFNTLNGTILVFLLSSHDE